MGMAAYYSENDPFAAAWLRDLIKRGLIADGEVDERSIVDVEPADVRGFRQCHFFAGIGGWSYALRLAGWPDDRPVWTGSCPCQPLSIAGKRKGHADERHLWPAFHRLIAECRPATVFGEQVASKDGREWFSAVRADLEADGYACGAADLCAAGIGAPHIRQRLWWVAYANDARLEGRFGVPERAADLAAGQGGMAGRLADAGGPRVRDIGPSANAGAPDSPEGTEQERQRLRSDAGNDDDQRIGQPAASPTDGFWRDADWLHCRDERWRPVEPSTFPLVNGFPNRVGLLRGAGNAIVAPLAATFIEAVMEAAA